MTTRSLHTLSIKTNYDNKAQSPHLLFHRDTDSAFIYFIAQPLRQKKQSINHPYALTKSETQAIVSHDKESDWEYGPEACDNNKTYV